MGLAPSAASAELRRTISGCCLLQTEQEAATLNRLLEPRVCRNQLATKRMADRVCASRVEWATDGDNSGARAGVQPQAARERTEIAQMNLCEKHHDEVCYEGKQCPMCALIKNHKSEIEDKEARIDQLESEIEALKEPLIIQAIAVQEANERTKT